MHWIAFLLGGLLGFGGLGALYSSIDLIGTERGNALLIVGALALTGGILTTGIALVLVSIRDLRAQLRPARALKAEAAQSAPVIDAPVAAAAPAPEPAPPAKVLAFSTRRAAPPAPAAYLGAAGAAAAGAGLIAAAAANSPQEDYPESTEPELEPAVPEAHGPAKKADEGADAADLPLESAPSAPAAGAPHIELRGPAVDIDEASAPEAEDDLPPPPPVPETLEPTVVGRYNAGGANYAMYSDGSIEAETPSGNYRFGSMTELKAFVEDSAASATQAADQGMLEPASV